MLFLYYQDKAHCVRSWRDLRDPPAGARASARARWRWFSRSPPRGRELIERRRRGANNVRRPGNFGSETALWVGYGLESDPCPVHSRICYHAAPGEAAAIFISLFPQFFMLILPLPVWVMVIFLFTRYEDPSRVRTVSVKPAR